MYIHVYRCPLSCVYYIISLSFVLSTYILIFCTNYAFGQCTDETHFVILSGYYVKKTIHIYCKEPSNSYNFRLLPHVRITKLLCYCRHSVLCIKVTDSRHMYVHSLVLGGDEK